ncbi:hypothetical protein D3C87_1670970 [compost metagenome]
MPMPRQVRCEVRLHTNRAHTWTTTTVRDAESLVKIQVRYITTELARRAQADHGIHVCPIDVNLTSVLMHDVADLTNPLFKNAMS